MAELLTVGTCKAKQSSHLCSLHFHILLSLLYPIIIVGSFSCLASQKKLTTVMAAAKESNIDFTNNQHACEPCRSFGQKCSHIVKKQRARFYIVRRCIAMLVCWRDRGES
ncbi:hypothetical protein ACB092_09G033200 [Castanea dentata]